jgi:protein O-mannosyl-transferase
VRGRARHVMINAGMSKTRRSLNDLIICLMLAALTVVVYARVTGFEFVNLDDDAYVRDNPAVTQGLSVRTVSWAFTTHSQAVWHPLVWISYMADVNVFRLVSGTDSESLDGLAGTCHVTNVVLHAACAILLFVALRRMTGQVWRSGVVAMLFAVHPLRVESVAWIAERKDVLSGLFWMLALIAYARYAEKPNVRRYLLVAGAFAVGLTAKPMLVTLPVVLLLLDFWPLGRLEPSGKAPARKARIWKLVAEKMPLLVLSGASSAMAFWAAQQGAMVQTIEKYPIGVRLANAANSYVVYVIKTLWPARLAVHYPHPGNTLPTWQVIAAAAAFVAVSALAVRMARSRPYVLVGWLWYVVTLLPVIGMVQLGGQAMADRYTYLPSIGLLLIAAWGIPDVASAVPWKRWRERRMSRAMVAAAVVAVAAFAWTARAQTDYWKDTETLMRHTIEATPNNLLAYNNLGNAYLDKGDFAEAERCFRRLLDIGPETCEAYYNLGVALGEQNRIGEAERCYEEALRVYPAYPMALNNLGNIRMRQGRVDDAVRLYTEAISADSKHVETYMNLGNALWRQGRFDDAIKHYYLALSIDPNNERIKATIARAEELLKGTR